MNKKIFIWIFSILVVLSLCGVFVYNRWPEPPIREIDIANKTLISARDVEANKYVPELFKKTHDLYDSSINNWKKENEKFILNRNFTQTKIFALESAKFGKESYIKAIETSDSIHKNTEIILAELEKIKNKFEKFYKYLPLEKSIIDDYNQSTILILESKLDKERSSEFKLVNAKNLLVAAEKKVQIMLENYFESFPKWKIQIKDAIKQSHDSLIIIVDKMAHKCLIYQNGKLKSKFDAEFGHNWIGNKNTQGDQATPEGIYQIIHKKEKPKTVYYKALVINYPNNEDKIRYQKSLNSGDIPIDTKIGSLIEIHGEGGRGFNWTNGCVALANEDMDSIYKMIPVNTPAIIVGSIEPIDFYLK